MIKFSVNEHEFELDRSEIESLANQAWENNKHHLENLGMTQKMMLNSIIGMFMAGQKVPAGETNISLFIKNIIVQALDAAESTDIKLQAREVTVVAKAGKNK